MPELPEVEASRRLVERWSIGRQVVAVEAPPSRVLGATDPEVVRAALQGRTVERTLRKGKHLLVGLSGGAGLYLHLGMSGRLLRRPVGSTAPHLRLALDLSDGQRVMLLDPRMFGRVEVDTLEALQARTFGPLGADAWDALPDAAGLAALLGKSSRPIKIGLMDQERLAGLGNIQAAEALWRAKIDPERPSNALRKQEWGRLVDAIRDSLKHTLANIGTEEVAYGADGGPNMFLVYDRAGEPCARCRQGRIVKTVLGGRATYTCPRCQKP